MPGQHALSCMWDLRSQEWDATVPRMGLPTKSDPFTPVRQQREHADSAERSAKATDQARIRDLRTAMQHRETRALLRWFLGHRRPAGTSLCPTYSTFNTNAMEMGRAEGRREMHAAVWDQLEEHAPVELALLQQEGKEP